MLRHKAVISLNVSIGSYRDFVSSIIQLAKSGRSAYVCVANVHMLIEAVKDKAFQNVVNSADIVTPDGMPLANALKHLYGIRQERVDGMSLLPTLIEESIKEKLSVFFYGGSEKLASRLADHLRTSYGELDVAGIYSPPFRTLTSDENEKIIEQINKSNANIVFVALGCPKQEKWMYSMHGKIKSTMIGIGGALPVFIGLQSRAPKLMQRASLEWLYRLFQEPKRLFKRYFFTNSYFLFLYARAIFTSKFNYKNSKKITEK